MCVLQDGLESLNILLAMGLGSWAGERRFGRRFLSELFGEQRRRRRRDDTGADADNHLAPVQDYAVASDSHGGRAESLDEGLVLTGQGEGIAGCRGVPNPLLPW